MPQDGITPSVTPSTSDSVSRLVALSLHTKACRDAHPLSCFVCQQTRQNAVVSHPAHPDTCYPPQDTADLIPRHGVCLMLDDATEPSPMDDVASE